MNAYGNAYGGGGQRRGMGGGIRWIIPLLFIGFAAFRWFASAEIDPYTGEKAHYGTSAEQDVQMGAQAFNEMMTQAAQQGAIVPPNQQISQQVTQIAQRLIAKVPAVAADLAAANKQPVPDSYKNFQWDVKVIQSDEENAFCLPGGKMAVFTGLVPVAKNQDGMAVVMGHEIAHALLRHSSQRMAQQQAVQIGAMGAQMGGVDPGLVNAGAQYGLLLPYGRNQESQADQVGLMLAAAACYNPEEAVPLWERMSQIGGGKRPPEFASTHPDPANRIQRLKQMMPQAKAMYAKYCGGGAPSGTSF